MPVRAAAPPAPGRSAGVAVLGAALPQVFGVDIGGTGIKGAPVDLDAGTLSEERHKVYEGNARRVYPRLDKALKAKGR